MQFVNEVGRLLWLNTNYVINLLYQLNVFNMWSSFKTANIL